MTELFIKPAVVDWRITSACDLACPFCYGPKKIKAPSIEDALTVANHIIRADISTVCLSGGEPTLYPFIEEIASLFFHHHVKVFLSTDGNFFEANRKWIEKYVTKLSLPIDGHTPMLHAASGRSEQNFHNITSILEQYKKHKPFFIKIGTVVSKINSNAENLNLIKILLQNFNIDRWKIYEYLPEGDFGKKNINSLLCKNNDFEKIIREIDSENTKFKIIHLSRAQRVQSHFLIQPNSNVVIPIDNGETIEEKHLGNILTDPINKIIKNWSENVNITNYKDNPRFMVDSQ